MIHNAPQLFHMLAELAYESYLKDRSSESLSAWLQAEIIAMGLSVGVNISRPNGEVKIETVLTCAAQLRNVRLLTTLPSVTISAISSNEPD